MGKLFWKFLFMFWLAQAFTGLGVGLAIWGQTHMHASSLRVETPPPPFAPPEAQYGIPPSQGMPGGMPPRAAESMPPHHGRLFSPLLPIYAGSIVSLIFAALLAWYFARPIRSLRSAFDAVANGKLETRIGFIMGGRKDELADLAHDFDRMAARLQALMESQGRLLHDVSHELRSPLARLQVAADLMRQQPERATEFIANLERDTGRMDNLVGELLRLARLDSGMAGRMDECVDLADVLEHIAEDAQFEAGTRCLLETHLPEHIPVKGNQELLFRALENVVRNALLHSPEGKHVTLSVEEDTFTKQWRVVVLDEGSGVPPDELEAIFEPFFRSGKGNNHKGYGLGLAITRRVVEAHGGTVMAKNRAGSGLAVTISLPIFLD